AGKAAHEERRALGPAQLDTEARGRGEGAAQEQRSGTDTRLPPSTQPRRSERELRRRTLRRDERRRRVARGGRRERARGVPGRAGAAPAGELIAGIGRRTHADLRARARLFVALVRLGAAVDLADPRRPVQQARKPASATGADDGAVSGYLDEH